MSKSQSPYLVIACRHDDPNRVVQTSDGEYVCACGVVLEEKILERDQLPSQSKASLYHQVENGGSPQDMRAVNRKIHVYSSSSSEFSNICSKLRMSDFIQQRAWYIYRTLRTHTDFSRAQCTAFSIYVACREGGQPIEEHHIQEVACSILCVKNAPSLLNVISKIHDVALKFGIDSNKGHSPKYYLNMAISQKQHIFNYRDAYNRFKSIATRNFDALNGNPQNRARRAVRMALYEMGI